MKNPNISSEKPDAEGTEFGKVGGVYMIQKILFVWFLTILVAFAQEQSSNPSTEKIVYENNFEKEELGKTPNEFLVLDGGFSVKSDGTNKFFELPGAPLETFGVLFGPT
ncbi:MAG: hypothetical protein ABJC04_07275, partial [Verrucomicrobiota bacterium]